MVTTILQDIKTAVTKQLTVLTDLTVENDLWYFEANRLFIPNKPDL